MQLYIVIGEAFGVICVIQRIFGNMTAVNGNGHMTPLNRIVIAHIVLHPALHTTFLVIIGTDALFVEIASDLAAVNEEIPNIFSCFIEILYKLRKSRHLFHVLSLFIY